MQRVLSSWTIWLCAGLLLSGCSSQPSNPAPNREELRLISHTLSIDAGEPRVMTSPQRTIRVTEQKRYQVTEFGPDDRPVHTRESYQRLPWANQTLTLIAQGRQFPLTTDPQGEVRLHLLQEQFLDLDFGTLRVIELVARDGGSMTAELSLLISRELRGLMQEAVPLIYGSLEEDDVDQWVQRVRRLDEIGLPEESAQLENMLILLTLGDPELRYEFLRALDQESDGNP
ncbi:hypothetical protein [Halopseudomonas pertucinogena]|uniref:Lipoprotein n=1 Tax=Halopseudomonas pertucinogena TaxID=86175 RepID=A0ABQ2CK05_9GAMM|nr:hypothetical protein [Halopseudomonas pertucinogena]GGI91775.1 hypothetical protein GCM10009083_05320 [Halopseudomonas pertucinogena]